MKLKDTETLFEQIALIFASFVWTTIILTAIALFWAYQDVQARWEFVLSAPPEVLAQVPPTPTPSPTPTVWAGPGPTLTPTATRPPTPTATRVIPLPEILPETLNPGDPTPIPVIVHTEDEAAEFGLDQPAQSEAVNVVLPLPTTNVASEPPPQAVPQTDQSNAPTPVPPVVAPQPAPQPAEPSTIPQNNLVPTHLVIESVGIDSKIIAVGWNVIEKDSHEYSIWQVADYAVGWHKTTAMLGQPGNSVMAGHHNVNGEVFRDLVNVEVGDRVVAYAGGERFEYEVELKTIVKEKGEPIEVRRRNAEWIAPTDDERLTFVTCWPYTNNTHRVIVVAKPI
jgi:sortase A